MLPLTACRLYTFVDTAYLAGRSPEMLAQQLCDGGADVIQFRAKNWSTEDILRTVEKLLTVTNRAGVGLVVNDHWTIAQKIGAPFCHLGQEDFFDNGLTHVSQLPLSVERSPAQPVSLGQGPGAMHAVSGHTGLGLSSHSPEQAQRAVAAGADYIAVGPVFATATKPTAKPVTLDYVRWAANHVQIPWFAIGGITLENLDDVLAAGARRLCVVSAILRARSVLDACRAFKEKVARVV